MLGIRHRVIHMQSAAQDYAMITRLDLTNFVLQENLMRLHDFVPMGNPDLGGGLAVEELFGPQFYAMDETGQLVTTKRNQLLLMNARAILRGFGSLDPNELQPRLAELAALADFVSQDDYDRARRLVMRECVLGPTQPEGTAELSSGSLL
jgi:hypothetical protein